MNQRVRYRDLETLINRLRQTYARISQLIPLYKDLKENRSQDKENQSKTANQLFKTDESFLNIANDRWTIRDDLGLNIYAYTLARFITHEESNFPLSISIQAPWGGGKTSLMKMMQHELDTQYVSKANEFDTTTKYRQLKNRIAMHVKSKRSLASQHKDPNRIINYKVEGGKSVPGRLTIWFNPWRYQHGDYAFAGLIDCIFKDMINRMEPVECRIILLKTNLKMENINDLASWTKHNMLSPLWKRIKRPILNAIVAVTISVILIMLELSGSVFSLNDRVLATIYDSVYNMSEPLQTILRNALLILLFIPEALKEIAFPSLTFGLVGMFAILALVITLSYAALKVVRASTYIQNLSVDVLYGDIARLPKVIELDDLKPIINTISFNYLPMVIFIDDLDRCSPDTVTKVIEGINSIVNMNLPIIFVIAMDAEMVAAALEVAHGEVISKLPEYSTHTPIGWKFMDKFVQLPIVLPPFGDTEIGKYVERLLSTESKDGDIDLNENNSEDRTGIKEYRTGVNAVIDSDTESRTMILKAVREFSTNPRDIKRFINLSKFYRVLREVTIQAHPSRPVPNLDQIGRWTMLSLRWPSLIRWLYWSPGGNLIYEMKDKNDAKDKRDINPTRIRLRMLENMALQSENNQDRWEKYVESLTHMKYKNAGNMNSLFDENLRYFFTLEYRNFKETDRISNGAGRGIY